MRSSQKLLLPTIDTECPLPPPRCRRWSLRGLLNYDPNDRVGTDTFDSAGEWNVAVALATEDVLLAYEIARTAQAINAENDAYDEGMRALGQLNAIMAAHPRPNVRPLAGRYTAAPRQKDHDRYKDVCARAIPESPDPCSNLSREIDRGELCVKLMRDFDIRYQLGNRHSLPIQERESRVDTLKEEYDKRCTSN